MLMKIIRISKTDESETEVTLEKFLSNTEGKGYYKKGTVEQMLQYGLQVNTPFAIYEGRSISN